MELASKHTDKVTCIVDSELVYNQLLGKCKVKHPKLIELFLKVQKMQEKFKTVKYLHVSRWDKFQVIADELLNDELDGLGYKRYKK